MKIPWLITIWYEVFFTLRVYFNGLVIRKKVFLESNHLNEIYLDVVVEAIEVQSSVCFELFIDEKFIELC